MLGDREEAETKDRAGQASGIGDGQVGGQHPPVYLYLRLFVFVFVVVIGVLFLSCFLMTPIGFARFRLGLVGWKALNPTQTHSVSTVSE